VIKLTEKEVLRNHVYQGRDKNLRQILWIGENKLTGEINVQYDSPTVRWGRHYPKTTMDKFLRWVRRDVTERVDEYWNLKEESEAK